MKAEENQGVYGFRFNEMPQLPLCNLFAVGHQAVDDPSYHWDGWKRTDGPLLLFQYTVQGEGVFETEEGDVRIPAGRAFLAEIPGNHRYFFPESKTPWEFYFLLIRPRTVLPLWEEIVALQGPTPCLPATSIPIRMLKDIFAQALAGKITDPYLASSYVYQFVIELRRTLAIDHHDPSHWPRPVQEAVQFLDAHYHRMIGQEQLAHRLGLSKFHFLRTFTKHVGVTPNEYVNRRRIEKSISLLRSTAWSVERIAGEVGYSTGSYSIKVFQKLTGQTPGAFRHGNNSLHYNRLFFD